jgi:outer membrane protein assembly factor BamB
MRGTTIGRRGFTVLALGALLLGGVVPGDASGGPSSLGDLGEKALENLPWPTHLLRANLGRDRAVAVGGLYLMDQHLIVVEAQGRILCMDRRNLEPRWAYTLKAPLAQPPAEGPTHFCFLEQDYSGANWVQAISKRSGAEERAFPIRLPYAASAGLAANASSAFIASLGSAGNNKTLETLSLVTGRRGWGYSSTGMLRADPRLDPDGDIVIIAGDDGIVTALPADATAPARENWIRELGAAVYGTPVVTPEHVVVGTTDGILYCLNLFSGGVNWLQGIDEPIRQAPWVLGGYVVEKADTGVEGASPVERRSYQGLAFARNGKGLYCFDLATGKPVFHEPRGGKPVLRHGKWVVTLVGDTLCSRDATKNYEITHTRKVSMFDLIPTNGVSGELYACTHDGVLFAAIPK